MNRDGVWDVGDMTADEQRVIRAIEVEEQRRDDAREIARLDAYAIELPTVSPTEQIENVLIGWLVGAAIILTALAIVLILVHALGAFIGLIISSCLAVAGYALTEPRRN
jgi:hypothetical protein